MNPKLSRKANKRLVLVLSISVAFILLLGSSVRAAESLQKIRVGFPYRAFS